MGLPKTAKGGSKNKSKGGKEKKDGKPREPKMPPITVRNIRTPVLGTAILAAARPAAFALWGAF